MTLNQKNAQNCSLDIYNTEHFLHVSTGMGSSSENQTKAILHKTKLATFINSYHVVEESNSCNIDISLYNSCIMCWIWYLRSSLHTQCTVLTFVKYIGFFQDTLEQDPAHLYNYSIWFFYFMLIVYKWPVWFYVVLLWSLMMVTCESKHVGNTCVIMQYIYLQNNFFVFCLFSVMN